jgi:DNA-binding MarR family transcriptional regulator
MTEDSLPFDVSLGFQLRDANRAVQRLLGSRIQALGVTLGAWYFLRVLWEEEALTQRELAARTGMQEPTAVMALRGMERQGWITRDRSTQDRRKVYIRLTDAGRALRARMLPEARAVNDAATAGLTGAEIETLLTLLKRVRANVGDQPSKR